MTRWGCIAQRWHTWFSPSSPGFDSPGSQEFSLDFAEIFWRHYIKQGTETWQSQLNSSCTCTSQLVLQKVDYVVVGAVDVEVVRRPVLKVTGWVLDLPPLSSFNFRHLKCSRGIQDSNSSTRFPKISCLLELCSLFFSGAESPFEDTGVWPRSRINFWGHIRPFKMHHL